MKETDKIYEISNEGLAKAISLFQRFPPDMQEKICYLIEGMLLAQKISAT